LDGRSAALKAKTAASASPIRRGTFPNTGAAEAIRRRLSERALDRFKQKHPEEYDDVSAKELTEAEPRAWLLPVGALIVGPILIAAGLVWLIWVLVSWAF
jgi:hypothetical protein